MAIFEIQAPDGRTLEIEGNRMPNEQELRQIFANLPKEGAQDGIITDSPVADSDSDGLGERVLGGLDTAATIGSTIVAEPVAGLTGIATGVGVGAAEALGFDVDASQLAAQAVEGTRKALTREPVTEPGKAQIKAVGEALQPIGAFFEETEQELGDAVFDATGSPSLAAAATTIPTLATEFLGVGVGKGALRLGKGIDKGIQKTRQAREKGLIAREISEAAPSTDQIKNAARGLYKEIDDTGAVLKSGSYSNLVNRLEKIGDDFNINPIIDSKSFTVLKEARKLRGEEPTLGQVDNLRKIAQRAGKSVDEDAAIGAAFIDSIDNFLDTATPRSFSRAGEKGAEVAKKYKIARDLWGRAKRSETLDIAIKEARNAGSGFENGIRNEFRRILKNKNQSKFFTADEKVAMNQVVQGTKGANLAKTIGRLGWSEGAAQNILGAGTGLGIGGFGARALGVTDPVSLGIAAVSVPVIGQVSRKLAQRLTRNNAKFADKVIRAGKDAEKITKAYMSNTPKAQRDPSELAQLLMKPDINLANVKGDQFVKQSVEAAQKMRSDLAQAGGAVAATGVVTTDEQFDEVKQ